MKKNKVNKLSIFLTILSLSIIMIVAVAYAAGISKTSIAIWQGKGYTLKLNGTNIKGVSSSNKNIATINSKGYVKGIKAGTTKVSIKGTNGVTYKCNVKVVAPYLTKTKISMYAGTTTQITLKGTTIKGLKTSNSKIATINSKGIIVGKSKGTSTLSITGANKKVYKCVVTVVNPYLSKTSVTMYKNSTTPIKLCGAAVKSITSSDASIAEIAKRGTISSYNKKGTVVITVIDTKNKIYKCTVKVIPPTLNASKISIGETKTYQLSLKGATIKDAKSENKEVATITNKGLVKGVKKGDTIVTVIDIYNNEYKCNVNIDDVYLEEEFVEIFSPLRYNWGYSIKDFKGYKDAYYPKLHNAEVVKITADNGAYIEVDEEGKCRITPVCSGNGITNAIIYGSNGKRYKMKFLVAHLYIAWDNYTPTPNSIIEFRLDGTGVKAFEARNASYWVEDSSVVKIYKKNNRWYFKTLKEGSTYIKTKYHGQVIQTKITVKKSELVKNCNHNLYKKLIYPATTINADIYSYKCSKCKKIAYYRQDIGNPMEETKITDGYYTNSYM